MMATRTTPADWTLEESPFQPERNRAWESLGALANGYIGLRAFPEEPFDAGPSTPGVFVAGVFNPGADAVPELVNATNILAVDIVLDGEPLRLAPDRIDEYRRTLDMKRALLEREIVYRADGGAVRVAFERFASIANHHLVGQSLTLTPLDWRGQATVRLWLDPDVTNRDKAHLECLHAGHMGRTRMLLVTRTTGTHTRIGHACRASAWVRQASPPKPRHVKDGNRVGLEYRVHLECGQRAAFDRLVATYTSRDPETTSVERCCLADLRGADAGAYGVHRRRHVRRWRRRWRRADINIDGPEDDQRAIRFAIFHLLASCPPRDPTVSIPAKGLTGEGYRGHVFWDTEVFMLPMLEWTAPRAARRLLEYRLHTLDGARRKARATGYQGAMFAWESTDTGDETCPTHVRDPRTGETIRVLTGELQHHITADVFHAAWRYTRVTDDNIFRERQLLVLAVETARFWAGRAVYNVDEERYEIRHVIGPDEYHEDVHNNAYTNLLAAWNLRTAADQVDRMRRVHRRSHLLRHFEVAEEEVGHWRRVADGLDCSVDRDGLIEQFDGFFDLKEADPARLSVVGYEGSEKERMKAIHASQILKQADVLMLPVLLPGLLPKRVLRRNWDVYEPRTTHDSSLSPSVHSIVASDLGLRGKAYEYFRRSAGIDLHDRMRNSDQGLHLAAMGGTWQAVMRGFLGLTFDGPKPEVFRRLPAAWKRLATHVRHRRQWYAVEVTHEEARVRPVPPPGSRGRGRV
jgi:trehalose/maltose hydrolase-like predicted phosphorylase